MSLPFELEVIDLFGSRKGLVVVVGGLAITEVPLHSGEIIQVCLCVTCC